MPLNRVTEPRRAAEGVGPYGRNRYGDLGD